MKPTTIVCGVLVLTAFAVFAVSDAQAAITSAQRKELRQISRDLSKAGTLVRRKKYDEAAKIVDDADTRLKKVSSEAGLKPTDRLLSSKQKLISGLREKIEAGKSGKPAGRKKASEISFVKQVAPILNSKCGRCHGGNRASGQLSLGSYAGMIKGGSNGLLLVPKNPNASLIMRRLTAPAAQRMPRNAPALSKQELQTIAAWITQGGMFDGDDKATLLANLKPKAGNSGTPSTTPKPKPSVKIAKATGNEKVSFKDDIAPEFVIKCLRCHGGNNPRGGFSMETFELLMTGGDTGRVLLPGNVAGSRMIRLIRGDDKPQMPQGQARIKKKWYEDLQTWIAEGLKYDAGDPKIRLRELVPTDEEKRAAELAAMSADEWETLREERTTGQFKRVAPRDQARFASSKEFYVYGNTSEIRLKEISAWAEEHAKQLRALFKVNDQPIWKGKLAIFVMRDRFGYTEFNQVIHQRDTPRELTGHSMVTPTYEDAYIVVEDIGNDSDESSGGLQVNLIDHITGAFLKRGGANLPDWVTRGTGLAMAASKLGSKNPFVQGLRTDAVQAVKGLDRNDEVFANNRFSPSEIGPVGFAIVDYMLNGAGPSGGRKFGQFIKSLQSGSSVDAAIKAVYPSASKQSLADAFVRSLSQSRK